MSKEKATIKIRLELKLPTNLISQDTTVRELAEFLAYEKGRGKPDADLWISIFKKLEPNHDRDTVASLIPDAIELFYEKIAGGKWREIRKSSNLAFGRMMQKHLPSWFTEKPPAVSDEKWEERQALEFASRESSPGLEALLANATEPPDPDAIQKVYEAMKRPAMLQLGLNPLIIFWVTPIYDLSIYPLCFWKTKAISDLFDQFPDDYFFQRGATTTKTSSTTEEAVKRCRQRFELCQPPHWFVDDLTFDRDSPDKFAASYFETPKAVRTA